MKLEELVYRLNNRNLVDLKLTLDELPKPEKSNQKNQATTLLHTLHACPESMQETVALQVIYTQTNLNQKEALIEALSTKDSLGRSPLHIAAKQGNVKMLSKYFEHLGSFPNDFTRSGHNILHSAVKYGQRDTVDFLVKAQPKLLLKIDDAGFTPAELAQYLFIESGQTDAHLSYKVLQDHFLANPTELTLNPECESSFAEAYGLTRDLPHKCNLIDGGGLSIINKEDSMQYTVRWLIDKPFKICVLLPNIRQNQNQTIKIVCMDNSSYDQVEKRIKDYYIHRNLLDNILSNVQTLTQGYRQIAFFGFGAGGFSAQLVANTYLEKVADSNVKQVEITLINSPRVNQDIANAFAKQLEELQQRGIDVRVKEFISNQDKIHLLGSCHLCSDQRYTKFFEIKTKAQHNASEEKKAFYFRWEDINKIVMIDLPKGQHHAIKLANKKNTDSSIDFNAEIKKYPKELRDKHPSYPSFSSGEYCFHYLAYKHIEHDTTIPVLDIDGETRNYKISRLHHQEGYYVYAMIPETSKGNLKIVFQGTDFSELASALRDLDRGSAGYRLFKHMRLKILFKINQILADRSDISHIIFGGHSLGGADAQNFFTYFLLALAQGLGLSTWQNKESSLRFFRAQNQSISQEGFLGLKNIKVIDLNVYNAAGVRKSTDELSGNLVNFLEEKKSGIKINAYYQIVHKDPVSGVGESYILSNALKANNVDVYCLHFHEHANAETAHTDYHFRDNGNASEFKGKLYHNEIKDDHERLELLLTEKFEPNTQEYSEVKTALIKGFKTFL